MKPLPLALSLAAFWIAGCTTSRTARIPAAPVPGGRIVTATALAQADPAAGIDAFAAGRQAAEKLRDRMGGVTPQTVLLAECFTGRADKEQVARGVASVFGAACVVGTSCYGVYTREGLADRQAVGLLGLGGDGLVVRTALVPRMRSAGLDLERDEPALAAVLGSAGKTLAAQLPVQPQTRLLIVLADAHSPKNQYLLDGLQSVTGATLAITGGSANKNKDQNWLLFRGRLYTDAAIAIAIDGAAGVVQTGAQARDNQAVLDSARQVAARARKQSGNPPLLYLAFDCAGRKGKLDDLNALPAATLDGLGPAGELFGVWCAGEFGCAEDSAGRPVGRGWHIMGTLLHPAND